MLRGSVVYIVDETKKCEMDEICNAHGQMINACNTEVRAAP